MRTRSRFSTLSLIASSLALTACLGGGGGGSSTGDDPPGQDGSQDDTAQLRTVTSDNALETAQAATEATGRTGAVGEQLDAILGVFSDATDDTMTAAAASTATTTTAQCTESGTITAEMLDDGDPSRQTIRYTATNCDNGGNTFTGALTMSLGPWSEYPDGGQEVIMAFDENGFYPNSCTIEGAFGYRMYVSVPTPGPTGDYVMVVEYGTTDSGFSAQCPDLDVVLSANTSVRNELRYTVTAQGATAVENSVTVGGQFQAPDWDAPVQFTSTDLEYATSGDGTGTESLYGDLSNLCPAQGSIVVTGEDDSQVSVYFGDDAPAGYAVQVQGPDGYVGEFQTCDDFLAAENI